MCGFQLMPRMLLLKKKKKKKKSKHSSCPSIPPPRSVSNANIGSYTVLGSQSVTQSQQLQHHPKNLLEMQIMDPIPDLPPNQKFWGGPSDLCFHKPSSDSDAHSSLKITATSPHLYPSMQVHESRLPDRHLLIPLLLIFHCPPPTEHRADQSWAEHQH